MDISRLTRWHVHVTAASMLFLALLTTALAPVTSSSFLETVLNENNNVNCLSSRYPAVLKDITMETSSLSNIFDHLLPNILTERVSGSQGNMRVREFIKREMNRLHWLVEEDIFTDRTPYGVVTFSNIIATLNPAATKRVVIACHYDSKYMPGDVPFVAASDSAVPCSVMMDLGRQLTRIERFGLSNNLRDITPQLIFFDGEEAYVRWTASDSLYGSRHLANLWEHTSDPSDPSAVNNLVNINFFVLMDLIGTSDTRFVNYYSNTSQYFHQLVSIEQCLRDNNLMRRKYPVAIFSPFGRAQMVEDDHTPFIRRGVPVLHLISTPFPAVWHTTYDNLSSLDLGLIDDFSRIFRIFLVSVLYGV